MKNLIVVRHAKSSWDFPELKDIDRPLNPRGEQDAPRMADYFSRQNYSINLMITSPSKRALETCTAFARKLGFTKGLIMIDHNLFHANSSEIMAIIRNLKPEYETVMIFGHNPGLTDFVNRITNSDIENIPTTGIAIMEFSKESWKELRDNSGTLIEFMYPKKLK